MARSRHERAVSGQDFTNGEKLPISSGVPRRYRQRSPGLWTHTGGTPMIVQLPLNNEQVMVVFRLPAQIWADSIHLVGDFNNWSTSATPMRRGEQYWEATVTVPAGSTCYYAYLVDGKYWCSEYNTARHARDYSGPRVAMIPIEIAQADELALMG